MAPAWEVAAWAANLPPDGAVYQAANSDGSWQHTIELELQRQLLWELQVANYYTLSRTDQRVPEPTHFIFPWEDGEDDGTIKGDSMTTDEADDWLGWSHLKD